MAKLSLLLVCATLVVLLHVFHVAASSGEREAMPLAVVPASSEVQSHSASDERSSGPSVPAFVPTHDWQEIPEGATVPPVSLAFAPLDVQPSEALAGAGPAP